MLCIKYSRLLGIYLTKDREKTNNASIRTCVNKIENRFIFKTKREYNLKLLTPEILKFLETTE